MTTSGAALAALALLALSCKGGGPPSPGGEASTGASSRPRGADRVAPGELAEGTERAFGLAIPRKMRVTARFDDAVFASGPVAREDLANYVRERVAAEGVETGPVKTVFAKARPKGQSDKLVFIEVARRNGATELIVRDQTRPPADPSVPPDERMKRVGLTPDGKLLDPKRLE